MRRIHWLGLIFVSLMAFVQSVSAQTSYQVRVGDTLSIEVLQDPSLNRTTEVLPDGSVSFPFAGVVPAAGRTITQIQAAISGAISSNFTSAPDVFISVQPRQAVRSAARAPAKPRTIDVYMLGEVTTPGLSTVKPGTTLLQGIAVAGGLSRFAATKRIQLRRTDSTGRQRVTEINYNALQNGAALSQDIELRDGDIILVPERHLFE